MRGRGRRFRRAVRRPGLCRSPEYSEPPSAGGSQSLNLFLFQGREKLRQFFIADGLREAFPEPYVSIARGRQQRERQDIKDDAYRKRGKLVGREDRRDLEQPQIAHTDRPTAEPKSKPAYRRRRSAAYKGQQSQQCGRRHR